MPQTMSGMPAPKGKPAPPRKTAADFKVNDTIQDPFLRTNPQTGSTFDMADLLTHGHAYKPPKKILPSTAAKMAVLAQTEQTMPGDVIPAVSPGREGMAAFDRMAKLVRSRNMDILCLMDDFLKRPRGSRMPVRNRAFLNISDFRRALCYAFGDQWAGLALTTPEFEQIWKKYERKDVSHSAALARGDGFGTGSGYQGGGGYGQGQGQPESLIMWMSFAQDLQIHADGDHRRQEEKDLIAAEIALMAKSEAAEAAALAAHDADDNMGDAMARLKKKNAAREAENAKPCGNRGCTVGQVAHAKKTICDALLTKHDTVREALRDIDNDGSGTLQREEIKLLLNEYYLLKYVDFYTGMTRGALDEVVVDTLLDMVDMNGDGIIMPDEFAKVVMAGANTYFFDNVADTFADGGIAI